MKKDIHPSYVPAKVTCTCGNTWQTRSTRPELKIELCSQCHPLFTGKDVLIDSTGQVDKFRKRLAASQTKKQSKKKPVKAATVVIAEDEANQPDNTTPVNKATS